MTTKEFEAIKAKIDSAKEKKARAEGAMAKIEEQWKRDFKVNDIEEAEAAFLELKETIQSDETKLAGLYAKLEAAADWESI